MLFRSPRFGGTGSVWRSLAKLIGDEHFQFHTRVKTVDWENKVVVTDGGERLQYDRILSSMPLDVLATALSPSIPAVSEAAPKLLRSSSHIIGVGLKGEMPSKLAKKCWMYFPEDNCPFYRVTVFSHYSPNNVPEPETGKYWSLMTETSESTVKHVDREKLVEQTIQGLLNTGQINSRDQVVSTWRYTAEHGYPTP